MNDSSTEKQSKASALLALGVTRESAAFTAPSDEELASLLEAGLAAASVPGMDSTRKAQIVDAIANDPATFNRWMSLVDSAQTLELAGFASKAQPSARASADTSWFKSFFSNPFKGLATAGGGLVAASALMLMVTTSDDYQSQIDQLYGDYGSQWSAMPSGQSATRSVTSALKKTLSAEDSALYAGVQTGLEKLGDPFALPSLAEPDTLGSTDSLDIGVAENLSSAGQIAALSYFKCELGANPAYFTETLLLLEALQPAFEQSADATSSALNAKLNRSGDARARVCRFSKLAISRVSH